MTKERNKELHAIEESLYNYKFYVAKIYNIELDMEEHNTKELTDLKAELQKKVDKIKNTLDCLNEENFNLIKLRYFDKKTYDKISEIVGLTPSHLNKIIKDILVDMKIALGIH